MSFISLKVRAAFMVHGYDEQNREVVEQLNEPESAGASGTYPVGEREV